jgi:hypothetical protein
MKYLLLITNDPERFGALPAERREAWHGEYFAFTKALVDSGEMVSGDALHGPDTATTVSVRDGETITTDGPFAEMKEVIGGYYVVDVSDLDRAIELASQIPDARVGKIEVRPLVDMPDMPQPSA